MSISQAGENEVIDKAPHENGEPRESEIIVDENVDVRNII